VMFRGRLGHLLVPIDHVLVLAVHEINFHTGKAPSFVKRKGFQIGVVPIDARPTTCASNCASRARQASVCARVVLHESNRRKALKNEVGILPALRIIACITQNRVCGLGGVRMCSISGLRFFTHLAFGTAQDASCRCSIKRSG
jgi:hypothetical protein